MPNPNLKPVFIKTIIPDFYRMIFMPHHNADTKNNILHEMFKKKKSHISVSAYIYYIYYMSEFHPGRPCELHMSLFFLHTALWLDSLSVFSPN